MKKLPGNPIPVDLPQAKPAKDTNIRITGGRNTRVGPDGNVWFTEFTSVWHNEQLVKTVIKTSADRAKELLTSSYLSEEEWLEVEKYQ